MINNIPNTINTNILSNFQEHSYSFKKEINLLNLPLILSVDNSLDEVQPKSLSKKVKVIVRKKSKELEDIPMGRRLHRSYSQPNIFNNRTEIQLEKQACEAREGFLWKCIGRKPSAFSGFIYEYETREKYNNQTSHPDLLQRQLNVNSKNRDLYPAIELSPKEMINRVGKELRQFGYHVSERQGSVFMTMPDREALLGICQNLKEKHPEKNLPDFDIASSEGIADDLSYALEHLKGALLSLGCEFCHDHHFHIIPRIERVLEGMSFYQQMEKTLIEQIFSLYRKIYMATEQNPKLIKHSEKLNFILGMVTDVLFSYPPYLLQTSDIKASVAVIITQDFEFLILQGYIKKRFPDNTPTNADIQKLWLKVEKAANHFVQDKYVAKLVGDITQLKTSTQKLIKKNGPLFIQLQKEGFLIESFKNFDKDFLRWIIENPNDFLWLKKKGLLPEQILSLSVEDRKFITKDFKQLEKLFVGDNPSKSAIEFMRKAISVENLVKLSIDPLYTAFCNPTRLERLIKTGVLFDKIFALSIQDQKNLIIFSEYIVSDLNKDTSTEELSLLAKEGPVRNYKRYKKLVKKIKKVCDLYMFMKGWEEQPELLTIKENWLEKIEGKKIPLPSFSKSLSKEFSRNEYKPNCDPFEYCEIGIEELDVVVAPYATVFASKVYPLMKYAQWDPAKHRSVVLDSIPSCASFKAFVHTINFSNLTVKT